MQLVLNISIIIGVLIAEMLRNNSHIVVLCVLFRKEEYHYFHNTTVIFLRLPKRIKPVNGWLLVPTHHQ